MGSRTLAVVGDGRVGYYLLANDSGELPRKLLRADALLDDKCAN